MSVVHFEYHKNFWKEFPELKIPEDFNNLYTKDKSKDKIDSSQVMWAIQLCYHPDSSFYNIPSKQEVLNKDFLKYDMDWSKIQHLIDLYIESTLSEAYRSLIRFDEQMKKRSEFLRITPYTLDNAKDLDAMNKNTFAMFQDYDRIKKLLREESSKASTKPKSESEMGEI